MSASFQMLYSMKEFRDEIMTTDWNHEKFNSFSDIEKVKALKEIFTLMNNVKDVKGWGTQTASNTLGSYNPDHPRHKLIKAKTELIKLVKNESNKVVDALGTQHDVTELINLLLETMNTVEPTVSPTEERKISKFYYVKQESISYCKKGSEDLVLEDQPIVAQNLINLSFNGKGNIEGSITEAEKEEEVEKMDRCDDLNKEYKSIEYIPYSKITLTIPETNKYVIIALKRFDDQVNRVVDAKFKVEHDLTIDKKKFSLIGAVLHGGENRTFGHYIYQTYNSGKILNTYNDGSKGAGEENATWSRKKMTLNLNSYVLLYKRDEAAEAAAAAAAASTVAAAPVAAESGSKEITSIILNFGGKREEYKNFLDFNVVGKKEGGKKSRKPKSKKKRLRKTRRRKN